MIADRDEIGVERRDLARRSLAAQQHMQRVGGVADIGIRRDRIMSLGLLDQGAGDHREGADNGRLVLQPVLATQPGDGGPEAVDNRHAAGCRQQVRQPREGAFAGGT